MILLSFDIEEFDLPLEYGAKISFEQQIAISVEGTHRILEILSKYTIKATFFCTAVFALHAKDLITLIKNEGHEIASHGYSHSSFEESDLDKSKLILEDLADTAVNGFRMPRMKPVSARALKSAGYLYNSSLNPTFIPGRYNHLDKPRVCFVMEQILQIPASVTPLLRIPLFWLSMHNFPMWLYTYLLSRCVINDSYSAIYFHPWEFVDVTDCVKLPFLMRNNSGGKMVARLEELILYCKAKKYSFVTYSDFCNNVLLNKAEI